MACNGLLGAAVDGFVREEMTFQTDSGLVTRRTDQGTVDSVGEASVEYTLATGETASVTTDDNTEILTASTETVELGNSGRTRDRLVPQAVALTDVAAGAQIVVWAEFQADGSFLAQRIVVRPADETTADGTTDDATSGDAGAGITEVPASPAPADA